jgi:elongator complex protein 3
VAEEAFYKELEEGIKGKDLTVKELTKLKNSLCKKHGITKVPTNIDILIRTNAKLITKPMRSQSGIIPIAVMTKPHACPHGKCTFCPGGIGSPYGDVPQSYTGNEPSTMRAIRNGYDPYLIVMNRLEQFVLLGHNPQKVELIIQGGTFPALDHEYQESVIEDCFKAMNDFSELFFTPEFDFERFKEFFELPRDKRDKELALKIQDKLLAIKKKTTLEEEHLKNETTAIRCVGLTIETKPDWGLLEHGNHMLKLGCTRVELGVQTVYEHALKSTNRGHTVADTIKSMRILKDLGFKINAHLMPGLPGVTYDEDLAGLKQIFTDPDYRPDLLKIYPCQVAPGTPLFYKWKKGEFKPIDADTAAKMLSNFKETIPEYARVQRILRDVPTKYWADGVEFTNLRQYIHHKYKPKCRCIRCREPKKKAIDYDSVEMKVMEYDASNGKEFFISFDDVKNDLILGFCRLRFPSASMREEITTTSAIIRELHVNGMAVAIGAIGDVQHKGYGGKLLAKAEEIARSAGKKKMVVISGVGVREYYKKKSYNKQGPYMVRDL